MSVITGTGDGCEVGRRDRNVRGPTQAPAGEVRERPGVSPGLLKRIQVLPTRDRAIVELTLRANLSRAGIARALDMAPGQVSRRLQILYARLHDPLVVALFDDRCPLPPEHRQLGIEHILLGARVPHLADKHRLPEREVRQMLAFLRGWQKGMAGSRGGRRLAGREGSR